MDIQNNLYTEFVQAGFHPYVDIVRKPHEHECAALARSYRHEVDGEKAHAYSIVIRIFDMYRIPNYPKVPEQRYIFEAHVSYYRLLGDVELPATNVHYVVKSVREATDHAYRLWVAMGQSTE